MRIAFVSTVLGYPWGGADTLWTRAAEAAAQRGDSLLACVSPAVARAPRIAALAADGARIHTRSAPTGPTPFARRLARRLARALGARDPLVAALAGFRPDLVIISLGGTYDLLTYPDLVAWLRARQTPYRLIANWQEENPVLGRADWERARDALTSSQMVAFVSTGNLLATRRHLLHALPNARVLQNPLRWRDADITPWPDAPPWRLAMVSRLDSGKGIQVLLHAIAGEIKGSPDWQLNIYGQGLEEEYLRATVAHLGIGDRVRFRGHVAELRSIWAENHLLCSPSLADGVPMTIPEAMLCGRPVLATDVGGARDWIDDRRTGFICPAATVALLGAAVRDAVACRDRWAAMGAEAATAAAARYRPNDFLHLLAS